MCDALHDSLCILLPYKCLYLNSAAVTAKEVVFFWYSLMGCTSTPPSLHEKLKRNNIQSGANCSHCNWYIWYFMDYKYMWIIGLIFNFCIGWKWEKHWFQAKSLVYAWLESTKIRHWPVFLKSYSSACYLQFCVEKLAKIGEFKHW